MSLNSVDVDVTTALKMPDLLELRKIRAKAAKEGREKIQVDSWLYSFPRTGRLCINVIARKWCPSVQSSLSVIADDDFMVFLKELQSALLSDKDRVRMCRHLSLKTMVLCKHILSALEVRPSNNTDGCIFVTDLLSSGISKFVGSN